MNLMEQTMIFNLDSLPAFAVLAGAAFLVLVVVSKAQPRWNEASFRLLPRLQRWQYLFGLDTMCQDIRDLRCHNSSLRSLLRHEQLGHTYVSNILGQEVIHTIDPSNIIAITSNSFDDYEKGDWAKVIARYMGDGVLVNDGNEWAQSRALLKPLFRRNKAADLEMFKPHVDRLIDYLQQGCGSFVDLRRAFQMVVLDITTDMLCAKSTLSLEQYSSTKSKCCMKRHLLDLIDDLEPFGNMAIELGPLSLPVFLWNYRTIMGLVRGIQSFFKDAVQDVVHADAEFERGTVIQHMLSQGRRPEQVQGELQNIFFAAFDTTTALLTNLFDCIARDHAIVACLKAELSIAKESWETAHEFVEVSQLVYLRAAIHETLRLHSPITYHTRRAQKDTLLPHGSRTGHGEQGPLVVPKGTSVVWSTYTLNRSSIFCEDSDWASFRPERWLSRAEGEDKRQQLVIPVTFMPFGSGPRNCLGQQFAFHLTSYVAARVLSAFESMELKNPGESFVESAAVTHYNGRGTCVKLS